MQGFEQFAKDLGNLIWGLPLFLLLLGCGILFSVLTKFIQFRILSHGVSVIRGKYDRPEDAGQINHFQALCAALSATIGLGNITGVALAVQLGGPGAIFWMWVVGFFGMAIKFVECGLGTMFRDEKDVPDPGAPALMEQDAEARTLQYKGEEPPGPGAAPHARGEVSGGPMWYIQKGLAEPAKRQGRRGLYGIFRAMALLFATVTFISSFGAGNSFQAWNVAETLSSQFQVPRAVTGAVLAFVVALVIIGGIKRIGQVAGKVVPFMCVAYVLGALYIIGVNASVIPAMLALIVKTAFVPASAGGAFVGSTFAVAFTWGLRRALFSNEAGQGSAAIAHAAAKTDEPVREGIVAGIGPFIDTLLVCTMTALAILSVGVHNRPPVGTVTGMDETRVYVEVNNDVPAKFYKVYRGELDSSDHLDVWHTGAPELGVDPERSLLDIKSTGGEVADNWLGMTRITLDAGDLTDKERLGIQRGSPVHLRLDGASPTRFAFDTALYGLGRVVVTLAVLLFAFSTMISWSYYGEKGAEFLLGPGFVLIYKIMFVIVIFLACVVEEFSIVYNMSDALCGAMVFVNLPAALLLLRRYLRASKDYLHRLDTGQMPKLR